MSSHAERVKSGALGLPIHERARLAEELITSLDEIPKSKQSVHCLL